MAKEQYNSFILAHHLRTTHQTNRVLTCEVAVLRAELQRERAEAKRLDAECRKGAAHEKVLTDMVKHLQGELAGVRKERAQEGKRQKQALKRARRYHNVGCARSHSACACAYAAEVEAAALNQSAASEIKAVAPAMQEPQEPVQEPVQTVPAAGSGAEAAAALPEEEVVAAAVTACTETGIDAADEAGGAGGMVAHGAGALERERGSAAWDAAAGAEDKGVASKPIAPVGHHAPTGSGLGETTQGVFDSEQMGLSASGKTAVDGEEAQGQQVEDWEVRWMWGSPCCVYGRGGWCGWTPGCD